MLRWTLLKVKRTFKKSPFYIFHSKQEFAYKAWHSMCSTSSTQLYLWKFLIKRVYIKQIKCMEDFNSQASNRQIKNIHVKLLSFLCHRMLQMLKQSRVQKKDGINLPQLLKPRWLNTCPQTPKLHPARTQWHFPSDIQLFAHPVILCPGHLLSFTVKNKIAMHKHLWSQLICHS